MVNDCPSCPGQHLIVRMPGEPRVSRVYSISSGVGEHGYRISARRRPADESSFTTRLVRAAESGATLLGSPLSQDKARLLICGSPRFSIALRDQLLDLGVAPERIASEQFIPASAISPRDQASPGGRHRIRVNDDFEDYWSGADNLLEWLESAGLIAQSGCRYGACGSWSAGLAAGRVAYPPGIAGTAGPGVVLLCVARPLTDVAIEVELYLD